MDLNYDERNQLKKLLNKITKDFKTQFNLYCTTNNIKHNELVNNEIDHIYYYAAKLENSLNLEQNNFSEDDIPF